jgi:hypothetical protein
VKFTQADKDYFTAVRNEDPDVDQMFKDIRAIMEAFPGTKIKHLQVRDSEWGTPMPEGEPYVPIPRSLTIPNDTKKSPKASTAKERRRLFTKYKQ